MDRTTRIANIADAFEGIQHVNAAGNRVGLPDALRRLSRQNRVPVPLETWEAIAARIIELSNIAQQSALIAGDPPEAGWAPVLAAPPEAPAAPAVCGVAYFSSADGFSTERRCALPAGHGGGHR
jgi:hypothetical protein